MTSLRKLTLVVVVGAILGAFVLTPSDATTLPPVIAKSAFLDGFVANDQPLPHTTSVTNPAATVAHLSIGPGPFVVFASIVVGPRVLPSNTEFDQWAGLITCAIFPLNGTTPIGPRAKAEFQVINPNTVLTNVVSVNTLNATTTARGPGTIDFRCTDGSGSTKPSATYRFVQLNVIRVQRLNQADLNPNP